LKILGIIVEYNPFHNGHLYHLFKAKEITGADYIVAVMSGNFLQRGEPAIIDKWSRTKMALNAGVDLIIELPFVFSTQDANGFAFGAVKLLESLQIIDYLCFGCETDNLDTLCSISNFLHLEPQEYKELISYNCKSGNEFPKVRSQTICDYHRIFGIAGLEKISPLELSKLLKYPNNILALEYIKHLINLKSKIKPIAIKRMGASYHQKNIKGKISSATSIRNEILNNLNPPKTDLFTLNDKIKSTIPPSGFSVLERELREGRGPITLDSYRQYILATLRRMSLDDISRIHGVIEGLEKIQVLSFSGLLTDFVRKNRADIIIRGMRAISDFEHESQLALMNKRLAPEIETIFMVTCSTYSYLNSSIVKEIASLNGNISQLVPKIVEEKLNILFSNKKT